MYLVIAIAIGGAATLIHGGWQSALIIIAVLMFLVTLWSFGFYLSLRMVTKQLHVAGTKWSGPDLRRRSSESGGTEAELSYIAQRLFYRQAARRRLLGRFFSRQRLEAPNLATYSDAVEWARSNTLISVAGDSHIKMGARSMATLRLSPQSLPVLAELLISEDRNMSIAARCALLYNGAQIESDETATSNPTYYRVIFPDNSIAMIRIPR